VGSLVRSAGVRPDGGLVLEFDTGTFSVDPSDEFEAWEVWRVGQTYGIVCAVGGWLAPFKPAARWETWLDQAASAVYYPLSNLRKWIRQGRR
jgi:hypothetical protein